MSTLTAKSAPVPAPLPPLDPITLTVIQSGLRQVCNEMDLAFVRAAFNPVISEALDRSDGIYHPRHRRTHRAGRDRGCRCSSAPCSSGPGR